MRTKVPDVLVLGGGIVGEAWMSGFLAGAHQDSGVDLHEAAMFVGTSAGSIVAAHLAAGIPPGAPRESARAARPDLTTRGTLRAAVERAGQRSLSRLDPIAGLAITASAPAGALLRAALLASMPTGTHSMADMRDAYAAVLGSRSSSLWS